jgi:phospholipid N-methyltransferase
MAGYEYRPEQGECPSGRGGRSLLIPETNVSLAQSLRFFKRYLNDPRTVGAIAPSSPGLSRALCGPFRARRTPARVLEVGAGTGSVTRQIARFFGPEDRLDVCEINPVFGEILEREVLTRPGLREGVAEGRVRLLKQPVQALTQVEPYDYILSGLPFTSFELEDVEEIFDVIRRCLKPDGVFSYFEYVALRRASTALAVGKKRRRVRSVSSYMNETIRNHQFARRTVLRNLPPAHARHLRFDRTQAVAVAAVG